MQRKHQSNGKGKVGKGEGDLLEMSSDDSCGEAELQVELTALKRLAIIDAANVMYACTKYSDGGRLKKNCDAIGLLLLARRLLRAGFDVKMIIPDSYMKSNALEVHNHFILEHFESMEYLLVVDDGSHDDLVSLEMAKCNGGFVISKDKFRDHNANKDVPDGLRQIISQRRVDYTFKTVSVEEAFKEGKAALSTPKALGYLGIDVVLKPPSVTAMYALNHNDPTYGIVSMQRRIRSEAAAQRRMVRIDQMCEFILQEICQTHNVERPLKWNKDSYFKPASFDAFWRRYRYENDIY